MKPARQIEQSIRRLNVEPGPARREQTLHDLVEAHARQKEKPPAVGRRSFRRTIMMLANKRVAAIFALAMVLIGVLGLGTASVAFSQAGHAVNTTLARLRAMIVGTADRQSQGEVPILPNQAAEAAPNVPRKAITCAARFFVVSGNEQGVWQSLKEQGIDLIRASIDPEVYYAVLSHTQAESFDAAVALSCLCAPRITVSEGQSGTIAVTQAAQGLALAWRPTMSSDGQEVQSTISFHDGRKGFELSNVSTESGGAVLIRMNGVAAGLESDAQEGDIPKDALIRVRVDAH